jgi:hypothetical protein
LKESGEALLAKSARSALVERVQSGDEEVGRKARHVGAGQLGGWWLLAGSHVIWPAWTYACRTRATCRAGEVGKTRLSWQNGGRNQNVSISRPCFFFHSLVKKYQ